MKKLIMAVFALAITVSPIHKAFASEDGSVKSNFYRAVCDFWKADNDYKFLLTSLRLNVNGQPSALYKCADGDLEKCNKALSSLLRNDNEILEELRDKESKCQSLAAGLEFTSIKCDQLDKAYTSDLLTNYRSKFEKVKNMLEEGTPLDEHINLINKVK